MAYLLVHTLASPAKEAIQAVIDDLMDRYEIFDMSGIDPHITLKYYFPEQYLPVVESICEEVAKKHTAAPFSISGCDSFTQSIIFLQVIPSEAMKQLYATLHDLFLKKNVPLTKDETQGIHFHVTLAQEVGEQFDEVLAYLKTKEFSFDLLLDTLTILEFDGEKFSAYKRYSLNKEP